MPRDDERRGPRRGPPRPSRDEDVVKIHGEHAARAVLERRPEAVVRAYIDEARKSSFGDLMHTLAERRTAYRIVSADELDRVAASRHHEGVCVLAKPRPVPALAEWIASCPAAACALVLDGVENPHNLGAIVRTAAHFGVRGVWVVGRSSLHGALARVAEGGAEAVDVLPVPSATPALLALRRAGFRIVGATARATTSLWDERLPRRTVFVVGSERSGLSEEAEGLLEAEVSIPGTGAVESLNVASAAAVLAAEYARQRSAARPAERSAPPAP